LENGHFQNAAVTVSLTVLTMMAADAMVMLNGDHIASQLPYMYDQKLLTLC
jgi:hypothetical protein